MARFCFMLDALRTTSLAGSAAFFLVANVLLFAGSVAICWWLGRRFQSRRIFAESEPVRWLDVLAASGAIICNAGISVVGWWLWIKDYILLKPGGVMAGVGDCLCMLLFMDFGMYGLHRFVHQPWIFPLFHRFHHRHEKTNPISLFVLHPIEVIGFGALMIGFLAVYPMSPGGLIAYLTLNVLWGTLGHSGVEPFPKGTPTFWGIRLLGTSTFHAEHHEHQNFNFGFYTLIWDQLFGTLDPEYKARFRQRG